jgi:hypothetical protein
MSTRGAVAWSEGERVIGVYHHSDAYPTCLGAEVFVRLREHGAGHLLARLRRAGDWREVMGDGVCPYCGKTEGQPHSIAPVMGGFAPWGRSEFVAMRKKQSQGRPEVSAAYRREIVLLDYIERNRRTCGYPDPEARYHRHGRGRADQFAPFADPVNIEWVYVLLAESWAFEVWVSSQRVPGKGDGIRGSGVVRASQSGLVYTHAHVCDVPLVGDPDWQTIENQGRAMRR